MGPLHLNFGAKITELSIFQTICLLSIKKCLYSIVLTSTTKIIESKIETLLDTKHQ